MSILGLSIELRQQRATTNFMLLPIVAKLMLHLSFLLRHKQGYRISMF